MSPEDLNGKRVAVAGAGREGVATAEYLLKHGVKPAVLDKLPDPPAKQQLGDRVDWRPGPDYLDALGDFEIVFRSPGIPFLSEPIQRALKAGVTITSQTKWFFAESPAPVIGISGTKGKGTTAGLLAEMLEGGGKPVKLGGNIGTPPFEFLDDLKPVDLVVLELSSFQLQDLGQSPQTAILTNLTADHLEHHADVAEYHAAKASLVKFQSGDDLAIINADDPGSRELAKQAGGRVEYFSLTDRKAPAHITGNQVMLQNEAILTTADIPVPGPHNQRNVLAAALAARHYGVPADAIAGAVKAYRGLPYHLELVGEHGGVRYFNDSYATNPTATIPAIESFTGPVVLIAGGHDKGLDYEELARTILAHPVKAVVLIDPVGGDVQRALERATGGSPLPELKTISQPEDIVPAATELAKPGDVVLFSPAAASFGWFGNYKERGHYFTEQVKTL